MKENPNIVIIDGNSILTARGFIRKYGSMEQGGRSDRVAFHVIQPKYCEMLGIVPDEMLVLSQSRVWIPILKERIDKAFSEDKNDDLRRKVWQAHVNAYRKLISQSIMDYVYEHMLSSG